MLPLPIKPMLAEATPAPIHEADVTSGAVWHYGHPFTAARGMYAYEPKWDGVRLVIVKDGDKCLLYGRSGRILNDEYPTILSNVRSWAIDQIVLDGEVIAYDRSGKTSFQALQRKMLEPALLVHCPFDILYLEGVDMRRMPYYERREQLIQLATITHLTPTPSTLDGTSLWDVMVDGGHEGVIAKPVRSIYMEGKRGPWLKIKVTHRRQNVVVGYTSGEGSRFGTFGALVLATNVNGRLVFAGKVGTGFTRQSAEQVLRSLTVTDTSPLAGHESTKARRSTGRTITWVKPDRSATIEFSDTTADGMPRFPSYKGLR